LEDRCEHGQDGLAGGVGGEQVLEHHLQNHGFTMFCLFISRVIQLTPQQQSAEPRNSASAEALAVARRPKEASREKTRPPPVSRGSSP